ncbi:uncharacterized protein [Battus philenor]|uniref:uncharacterized protein isoform X1 n=1 Tax=Battus philenor TaxID=42288 RepID=UPI0035CFC061
MSCEIIIRAARPEDRRQRAELIELGFLSHQWDAFIYFLFQEVTLECALLAGAVLFIFCGAAPAACALLLPAAAAVVAAAAALTHRALAQAHAPVTIALARPRAHDQAPTTLTRCALLQRIEHELFGVVAEARGPPGATLRIRSAPHAAPHEGYSKVVGTGSVSRCRGAPAAGWLHELAVHPQYVSAP